MRDLLETVDRPGQVGYQADMAHSMLYTLGYNAEAGPHPARRTSTGPTRRPSTPPTGKVADALRPWTLDFHVAQNDGTVFGSGDHEKTGRHCRVDDPNGRLDVVKHAGFWLRDENGDADEDDAPHLLGRLHAPERGDGGPADLEQRARRHGQGPRRPRLDGVRRMPRDLNIGMIGYGFMGRCPLQRLPHRPELLRPAAAARCSRPPAAATQAKTRAFADTWGYESVETDWRKLVARPDIDLVDICVPNDLHKDIAVAAAEAGKIVITEKPIARTTEEGEAMVAAVEKAGVPNLVCYNYRRIPAVSFIKQIVDAGKLGRIYHYRASFLQDWTISPDVPQGGQGTWRLDVEAAGSGVTGDLLAHCIDTAMWINGPISSLTAMTETFVKERTHAATGKLQPVGIDDAAAVLARYANGSLGTFESTRYARGHKALYTLEINGEHGSFAWDLHDLNRVAWFDHRVEGPFRGWSSILVTDGEHPYLGRWWVPGLTIGYEHSFVHTMADFIASLDGGAARRPDLPRRAGDHEGLRRHHRLRPVRRLAVALAPDAQGADRSGVGSRSK